jgi:hypothetical protein
MKMLAFCEITVDPQMAAGDGSAVENDRRVAFRLLRQVAIKIPPARLGSPVGMGDDGARLMGMFRAHRVKKLPDDEPITSGNGNITSFRRTEIDINGLELMNAGLETLQDVPHTLGYQ